MTTSVRIDVSQGIVEVEGSEAFVKAVYDDFKGKIATGPKPAPPAGPKDRPKRKLAAGDGSGEKKSRRSRPKDVKVVDDLDLAGSDSIMSLRDFYAQYGATTNLVRNVIFVRYLKNEMKIEKVTVDHVFTCYRNIPGLRIPGDIKQSLLDARRLHNWLDTSSLDDITMTIHGTNYFEHDLKSSGVTGSD